MIMKICIGVLVGIGLFMILADRFRIPYMRTSKAVNNLAKQQKEKTSSIDVWLSSVASFIARKIRLNEFKKAQLESDLRTAQMDITPEMFMANAIVKSLIVGVFAIPVLFIFPILCPIIIFLAFILYRMNMKGISNRIRAKRAKIEYELPRFVFKIEKSLMHSKDVLEMIESFAKNAGPEIKHELDITAADMHSGNNEIAITRLEARVGSPLMWPLIINILGGINLIPKTITEYASNIELSKIRMFSDVYIFAIMPCIISGLKIGWGRSWRALISAEMVFGIWI